MKKSETLNWNTMKLSDGTKLEVAQIGIAAGEVRQVIVATDVHEVMAVALVYAQKINWKRPPERAKAEINKKLNDMYGFL